MDAWGSLAATVKDQTANEVGRERTEPQIEGDPTLSILGEPRAQPCLKLVIPTTLIFP